MPGPVLLFCLLGLGLAGLGLHRRLQGRRHGPGVVLDAEAYERAGREQGNPLIVVGAALAAISLAVWALGGRP